MVMEIYSYSFLILLLPALSFVILALAGMKMSHKTAGLIGTTSLGLVTVRSYLTAFVYFGADRLADGTYATVVPYNFTWLPLGNLQFDMGILLDPISVMMLIVISTVSFMVHIYSFGYMHGEKGFQRYYAFLSLFTMSMLGLVLATNIFQMYTFWELVGVTLRIRNILVNGVHKLHDLVAPLAAGIFQSLQSGTADNGKVITGELILVKEFTNFHLDQVKELFVINHVALVHEYYDVRYADLTCKQNVLTCLSHNTIGSCYYEDSAVHLCCAGNHVLDIVSVAGAVNVCVMSFSCLILDVSSRDGDSSLSLFGSLVDLIESDSCTACSYCKNR